MNLSQRPDIPAFSQRILVFVFAALCFADRGLPTPHLLRRFCFRMFAFSMAGTVSQLPRMSWS